MTTNPQIIREILADGEWHDRGDVTIALAGHIPPVASLKAMEYERQQRGRGDRPVRQVPKEREELVRRGAYKIANRALLMEIWRHPNDYEWSEDRKLVRRLSTAVQSPQRRTLR